MGPRGRHHGADTDADGQGVVTGQRLYQLVRQNGAIADHTSSYHLALVAAMVLLLIAGGLFWQLPRDASTATPASSLGQMGSSSGS